MAERVEEGTVTESQIYPYPGATRSVVWKYFGFTKKKEGPPSKQNLGYGCRHLQTLQKIVCQ